jgi:SAM-dependent methyltransferase
VTNWDIIRSLPLRDRTRRRIDWFVDRIRITGAKRVLELGCGLGDTAFHVAENTGAEVLAVDLSDRFIDAARARYDRDNLRFQKLDLLHDDLSNLGTFGFVYGNGILHHLRIALVEVLERLRTVTSTTGEIAFIEPNLLCPLCLLLFGTPIGRRVGHLDPNEMAFTRGYLQRVLAQTGWTDVEVATRDFLLPGLPTGFIRPITAVEPMLEATRLTWWLAQSHFIRAARGRSP